MAFVLELLTSSSQPYIKNYIVSIVREYKVEAAVDQKNGRIICAFDSENEKLQSCIEAIIQKLPASCFLSGSKHYKVEGRPNCLPQYKIEYPLSLGLCPACQKELFDPSSRRYYYPFTSCTHCGGQYAFFTEFPYERKNTSFRFFQPCDDCASEIKSAGIREQYVINSCHGCGVPVRLMHKKSERYANDAGSFRTMFEVAAKAVADNKRVLIKTTMGYRVFYKVEQFNNNSILMAINANKITEYISLIEKEFNALLSIERPLLHGAIKDERLKQIVGNSADIKYPDDGFTILLAAELKKMGEDFILYEAANKHTKADILMDYDLEVTPQEDLRLFINKDTQFIASGQRVCFPSKSAPATDTLSIAHNLIGVKQGESMLFDRMEHFDSVAVEKTTVLDTEVHQEYHSNQHTFSQDSASFMSVIAEHHLFGTKCVGAYFDNEISFLYYDSKSIIKIVPSKPFETSNLLEKIAVLREGSDRLVLNFQEKFSELYERLLGIQDKKSIPLFDVVAIILELKDESMNGVTKEALKFIGKGGLQMDTKVNDNRFDHTAFLSSILSYKLAGVDSVMLSYSIFESFGDYVSELLQEIKTKTKSQHLMLCGEHFANQSLFSRIQRNLKQTPLLMNINYPVGKENAVVGGAYM